MLWPSSGEAKHAMAFFRRGQSCYGLLQVRPNMLWPSSGEAKHVWPSSGEAKHAMVIFR